MTAPAPAFTPAPWYCIGGAVYADPENERPIAFMCRDERATAAGIYPTERDANAHLIAAAPAMYHALVEIRAFGLDERTSALLSEALHQAGDTR